MRPTAVLSPCEEAANAAPDLRDAVAAADGFRAPATAPATPAAQSLAERAGWTVAALSLTCTGVLVWAGSLAVPTANPAALLLVIGGLLGMWRAASRGLGVRAQLAVMLGLCVGVAYTSTLAWIGNPGYGTDAVAFDQYAARLLLHGLNPYAHSMAPSLEMFHVPPIFHTLRLDGGEVTALSYPAGSFLFYVPVLAAGVVMQAANIVDLVFWLAGGLLLWRLLPAQVRWVAGLVVATTMYTGFIAGGLTDALFVPCVIVAVWRWDRFGDPSEASAARWIGPWALGLAMTVKQTPWFLVPFLVLGVWIEARSRGTRPWRTSARYLAVAVGVFTAVNLPFAIAGPSAWFRGTVVPLIEPTIPDGQGLVNLSLYDGLGGGRLTFYSYTGAVLLLATLIAFALRYDRLKRGWVALVPVVLFFPTRSLSSYLLMLVPAALVAATTVSETRSVPFPRFAARARLVLAGLGCLAAATITLAVFSPAPLVIHVIGTRSTGQLQTLDRITVRVTNRTTRAITPHFTINPAGHVTTFWYPDQVSASALVIPAHATRVITLDAPNMASEPGVASPLIVNAYTSAPATVSTSQRYLVSARGTEITPAAIDHPVPVGQPVVLTVQLENRYAVPLHVAGIPVMLSQVIYGENGLVPAESSINGRPEGATPVQVSTDARGIARFTVVGVQAQNAPVYYQAWINHGVVPHGYSNQVLVKYVERGRG